MPECAGPAGPLHFERAGDGPPVVLLPGLGFDGSAWGYQIAALKARFSCVALDNRGSGRSVAPEDDYALEAMAADVVALLDHLDLSDAHLVGMSLGGKIAQVVAAEHPARVRRLALVATAARGDAFTEALFDALEGVALDEGVEQALEHLLLWCYTPQFFSEQADLVAALRRRVAESPPPEHGFLGQLATVRNSPTEGVLKKIQAPTLVLAAADDRVIPPYLSQELAEGMTHADFARVPGGHGCCVEAAEPLNEALLAFLTEAD